MRIEELKVSLIKLVLRQKVLTGITLWVQTIIFSQLLHTGVPRCLPRRDISSTNTFDIRSF
jgi:hypothetical protein